MPPEAVANAKPMKATRLELPVFAYWKATFSRAEGSRPRAVPGLAQSSRNDYWKCSTTTALINSVLWTVRRAIARPDDSFIPPLAQQAPKRIAGFNAEILEARYNCISSTVELPLLFKSYWAVGAGSLSWSDGKGVIMPASIAAARAEGNSPRASAVANSGASRLRRRTTYSSLAPLWTTLSW